MDYAYRETDRLLSELEQRIREIYEDAARELQGVIDAYFDALTDRDAHQRELMEAGQITEEQYRLWRMAQIGRGERYVALREEIARRCNEANRVALSYVNDLSPGIYSLNYNYSAYTIEQLHGDVGFTLFDEQAVRRLMAEDPELLPAPRIDIPLDLKWNRDKMQRELVTGIMLGESSGEIAARFRSITDMNQVSALRNARTAVTGAQNAGRQESYDRAAAMGIKLRKRWVAAKDNRTRHSHGVLDGKTVEIDECFVSENGSRMLYPGDRNHGAKGCDIYNCRCGMRTVEKEGIEAEPRQMRVRNPGTGRNELVSEMTYSEWEAWKKHLENDAENAIIKSLGNTHPRNRSLENAIRRSILADRPIFCEGRLARNSRNIPPVENRYDIVLHGSPTSAELFRESITPQILANVLRARSDYRGSSIRLISCNTGRYVPGRDCFAQVLANILGVVVEAPNDKLWVFQDGSFTIGRTSSSKDGEMIPFFPQGGDANATD